MEALESALSRIQLRAFAFALEGHNASDRSLIGDIFSVSCGVPWAMPIALVTRDWQVIPSLERLLTRSDFLRQYGGLIEDPVALPVWAWPPALRVLVLRHEDDFLGESPPCIALLSSECLKGLPDELADVLPLAPLASLDCLAVYHPGWDEDDSWPPELKGVKLFEPADSDLTRLLKVGPVRLRAWPLRL